MIFGDCRRAGSSTGSARVASRCEAGTCWRSTSLTTTIAVYVALALRFDGLPGVGAIALFLPAALLPVAIRPITNAGFGLYRRLWRYASVADLIQILMGVIAGSLVSIAIFYSVLRPADVAGTAGFPRSFWVMEFLLSLAMTGGTRFTIRAYGEWRSYAEDTSTTTRVPALLYGAGRAGATIARSAMREPKAGVQPVGFLDDDLRRKGQSIAGVPVLGDLNDLLEGDRRDRRQDAADHDAAGLRPGHPPRHGGRRRRGPRGPHRSRRSSTSSTAPSTPSASAASASRTSSDGRSPPTTPTGSTT